MPDPFTIRIFVPDGDPDGVRIIDRMNWTGVGIVFPRGKWPEVRNRPEFARPGVYVLVGYRGEEDDLPTVYIGQGDGTRGRIEQHVGQKDFWDWGIAFASTSGGLNRAHITWLEYALVKRAAEARRCHLDNGNVPQQPALTEAEKLTACLRAASSLCFDKPTSRDFTTIQTLWELHFRLTADGDGSKLSTRTSFRPAKDSANSDEGGT
jgi:hypothetical protein